MTASDVKDDDVIPISGREFKITRAAIMAAANLVDEWHTVYQANLEGTRRAQANRRARERELEAALKPICEHFEGQKNGTRLGQHIPNFKGGAVPPAAEL